MGQAFRIIAGCARQKLVDCIAAKQLLQHDEIASILLRRGLCLPQKVLSDMCYVRLSVILFTALFALSLRAEAQSSEASSPDSAMVCEEDASVDTCWSQGKDYTDSNPQEALRLFEMSCDFGWQMNGCYLAGKYYLHDQKFLDYEKAYQRFDKVCSSDALGEGPYACKFLGWMHMTGVGAEKELGRAGYLLSRACFLHNDLTTDPEGCMLLGDSFLAGRFGSAISAEELLQEDRPVYLAYLSYSRGCMDLAEEACAAVNALFQQEQQKAAKWIAECERQTPEPFRCGDLGRSDIGHKDIRMLAGSLTASFTSHTSFAAFE